MSASGVPQDATGARWDVRTNGNRVHPDALRHDGFVGIAPEHMAAFTDRENLPLVGTREGWDDLMSRYGTPEDLDRRVSEKILSMGFDDAHLRAFRRMHGVSPLRAEWEARRTGVRPPASDAQAVEDCALVEAALDESVDGNFVGRFDAYCVKTSPEGVAVLLSLSHNRTDGLILRHCGFGAGERPWSLRKLMDKDGRASGYASEGDLLGDITSRCEDDRGFSLEEAKRAAAVLNGRRYLWPDERHGAARG